ncbi:MAG: Peptidyl-prolyl cis-trans isomerase, partial [uncultured Acidimicrobiales bacterium]
AHRVPRRRRIQSPQGQVRRAAPHVHRPVEALHRRDGHVDGDDRDRARRRGGAEHGEQLRHVGPLPLLRRRHLPPDHQGVHVPGRRPGGLRPGRSRLQVRRRAPGPRPLRGRLPGDGQRRPEHERQPVLHRLGAFGRRSPAAVLAVRQGGEGPRGRRRDGGRAHLGRRPPEDRRGDPVGDDHRVRL